jgi:alpha-2-macroglobulin
MKWLAQGFFGFMWLLRWLFSAIPAVFSGVFGRASYAAPHWLSALWELAYQRPLRALLALCVGGALAWGGYFWAHYVPPEPPNLVHAVLQPPALTNYAVEPGQALYFSPITLSFDASVAPVGAASNSTFAAAAAGVTLSPSHPGAWRWSGDRAITFTPTADWPVAAHFKVSMDARSALASHVIVDTTRFEFDTAAFEVSIGSEFNQDPNNALMKQAVYTLSFTHPVDAAVLEGKLSLRADADKVQFPEATLAVNAPLRGAKFSVRYSPNKLTAYVTTDALILPDAGAALALLLTPGATSTLGGPGAPQNENALLLPSLYSLRIQELQSITVENSDSNPEQVLLVQLNDTIGDSAISQALSAYVLPRNHPTKTTPRDAPPYQWGSEEVTEELLRSAMRLSLTHLPGEREIAASHSFKYSAPVGRYIYARIEKNTVAFGGTKLPEAYKLAMVVPEYPKALQFVGDGALLSLKGERRVSILSRNVRAMRVELARVLPDQLQHWVKYNDGSFKNPNLYTLDVDSVTERFTRVVRLPDSVPGATHFEGLDLSPYFTADKHGVFYITLTELNVPTGAEFDEKTLAQIKDAQFIDGELKESRLIVLSDLGVVSKTSLDRSRDVYVQRILSGQPAVGVAVDVIGTNGVSVQSTQTDSSGRARLSNLDDYKREHTAMLLRFVDGNDLTFLPLIYTPDQDFSRFDIGGYDTPKKPGELTVHAFSDRGLYRPGDTLHIGMIVRAFDWQTSLAGVPLRVTLTDPSDTQVADQTLKVNDTGFIEFEHTTSESSASGSYILRAYRADDSNLDFALGQTSVEVKEFLPDQMKIASEFSQSAGKGWLKPGNVSAIVQVNTLFGTPAQDRRVTASLSLSPTLPSFPDFPGFRFFDPTKNPEGASETLAEVQTDATGKAEFALGLDKYSQGTFSVGVATEAFEAGSGRSVTSYADTLVSTLDVLLGLKSADDLGYISKSAPRSIELLAIGPAGAPIALAGLTAVVEENRYVSVLTKQDSGVYKYVSQPRVETLSKRDLTLTAAVNTLTLTTDKPGNFTLRIFDANALELNAISYSVAGNGNLARALDRNAELELTLSKAEYQPGEMLEVNIRAPYTGAGLITIERDQVYAHAWFRADSESSVQRIAIPKNLEGGAYVSVQFVRSADSAEVYMSPLSYGALPFKLDRAGRTQPLLVQSPKRAKPGDVLNFDISTDGEADVAVFAIDEGILQVARYTLDNPLETFFPKRRLQVDTMQMLDLILPEFSRLMQASAPGGGDGDLLGSNLNPFKRKGDKPAAYWSGIQRVNGKAQLHYTPPEYFNGTLKVFAVAVSKNRIGTYRGESQVRGDFVVQANTPNTLSPGDQFTAAVNVSYPKTPEMTGAALSVEKVIAVAAQLDPGLQLVGAAANSTQSLTLKPGGEGVVLFSVQAQTGAQQQLGNASLKFSANAGALSASRTANVSVRPATPFVSTLRIGRLDEAQLSLKNLRVMWPQFSRRELVAGATPLVLARGLAGYLQDFPEACSEQLTSQAFAELILKTHPELAHSERAGTPSAPADSFNSLIATLAARQNAEGGFGLWGQTPDSMPFVSAYVGLMLVEAKARGVATQALWQGAERYLKTLAADTALTDLPGLRARALAVYVRTRAGIVTTAEIAAIQESLTSNMASEALGGNNADGQDVTSLLLAASLKLLKVDGASDTRAQAAAATLNAARNSSAAFADYYDPTIGAAFSVYLLNHDFPRIAKTLSPKVLEQLLRPIEEGRNNTLSSALTMLALDSGAQNAAATGLRFEQVDASAKAQAFGQTLGWLTVGSWQPWAGSLSVRKPQGGSIWYAMTEAGFDQTVGAGRISAGIEVSKRYALSDGKPLIAPIRVGDELTVTIELRSTDALSHSDIAVLDLLPGGFDVLSETGAQSAVSGPAIHTEAREDRVVIYATATADIASYQYRIKATNVGSYLRPRSAAYSMYARAIQANEAAQSLEQGQIVVLPAL